MDTRITTDQHVFIAGMTGTGKTFLARQYLSQFPAVAMIDTKGDTLEALKNKESPWPEVDPRELTIITKVSDIGYVDSPYMIYCPIYEELEPYYYNEFFRWCYFRRDITAWVDEAMNVSTNSQSIPSYYKGILTRGRSRNVSVWSLTQRPMGLSPLILSQCTHFFVFNLQLDQDRKKVVDVTGVPELNKKPGGHDFWYFREGWETAQKARLVTR